MKQLQPKELLFELVKKAKKMIIPQPGENRVDIWVTDTSIILYSHRKGSKWNLGGSHWFYQHDKASGEFQQSYNGTNEKPIAKERLLVADYKKLVAIQNERAAN